MRGRALLLVVVASLLAVALPRWLLRSRTPYNWDAANFTMAVEGIDLAQHRPHPPPAIGYVLGARVLRGLVGGEAHAALVGANVVFAAVSCVLVFLLAHTAASNHPLRHAWLAWVVFASSVQHAFNTCVGESYMSELATTLLAAWCGWHAHRGSERALLAGAAALALAGAFRLTGMIFLAPLGLFVLVAAPVSLAARIRTLAVFGLALAAWLIPLTAHVGPAEYSRLLWSQFSGTTESTRVLGHRSLTLLNRNLRDVAYSLVTGVGLFNMFALPVFAALSRPLLWPSRRTLAFAACWFAPASLFFVGVHMGKPGYTLMLLPVTALAVARTYAQEGRAWVLTLLVTGQLGCGALHFVQGHPPSGQAIGEGRPYREKTVWQKLLTESRALLQMTAPALRAAEQERNLARRAIDSACPSGEQVVLLAADGEGMNWRRAMQAFPERRAVRVPSPDPHAYFVGHQGRFEVVRTDPLRLKDVCAAVWLLPPSHPVDPAVRRLAGIPNGSPSWPLVTPAPLHVDLGPGARLALE